MSITALISTVASPVTQTSIVAPPSALATERFNAVMNAPDAGMPALTNIRTDVQNVPLVPVDMSQGTLGNNILAHLRSVTAEVSGNWQDVEKRLKTLSTNPNMADMGLLQVDFLKASINYDLIAKGITRVPQTIESVVKVS